MPSKAQARKELQKLIDQYAIDHKQNLSESDVIEKYLLPLFRDVLGWPTDYEHFKNELSVSGGRVDRVLMADNGERIYIEAKRFKVIDELEKIKAQKYIGEMRRAEEVKMRRINDALGPEQLALPSMAVDRTAEEQQAINYAFLNDGKWAILANFERLRLFNARRDWLVLSFESPAAYLQDFDLLWQLSYDSILNGSLDYLSNQRFRLDVDSKYLELINTWRQELGNDLLNSEDKNPWIRKDGKLDLLLMRSVVQRIIDRLVVVRFAEDHLVIPPGTLYGFYELRRNNIYTPTLIELVQPFFRKFDQEHNSALFSESILDKAIFSDNVLMKLVYDLYRVKFRAMPADILGNTYEQYLGKALVIDDGKISTRDNLETRKKQGSYYTPQVIVRYIVDNSLGRYLYGTDNGKADGTLLEGETRKTSATIRDLRVLDSACGSGSFLIYAYQVLRDFYESEITRLNTAYRDGIEALAQKTDPATVEENVAVRKIELERDRLRDYPRIILEQHLYGVDLDPQAAEIAVVNLMMRAMEKQGVDKRLPLILNQNVKVGNGLIGLRPDDERLTEHHEALATIKTLRADLKATPNTDPLHDKIIEDLETALTTLRQTLNAHYAEHFTDLEATRIFHWGVEFPEVFYDEQGKYRDNGGFQVIIGNPPWEIVKPDLREFYAQFDENIESRLSRAKAEARIKELNAEDPDLDTQWQAQVKRIEEQASFYRATDDYTKQGRGDTATHKLFVERVYGLLGKKGRLGYVVPSGIYTDLGTKDLREMFFNEGHIEYLYGLSNERWFFAGVHHAFHFTVLGVQKDVKQDGFWSVFRYNPRVAIEPNDFPEFVANKDNLIYMRNDSIERFSPDSLSIMEFKSQTAYDATKTIYSQHPLMGEKLDDTWNFKLTRELDMTNDREYFNEKEASIPLYEGKLTHQFDAYFAKPQNWIVDETKTSERLESKNGSGKDYLQPRLAIRAIASSTNERTLISCVIPPKVFCGNSLLTVMGGYMNNHQKLFAQSVLNSFALDFLIKNKVASNINMYILYQLPLPRLTEGNPYFDALVQRSAMLTCTRPEFADLWVEVMGSAWKKPLKGASAETVRPIINDAQRETVRHEIDALVAHLYGLSRAEFAHILSTFPLVFPNSNEGQAKQSALLAEYDSWQAKVKGWSRG